MKRALLILLLWSSSLFALTLHEKQATFSQLSASLIKQAATLGYEVTLGEAWRSEVVAKYMPTKWYADHGKGIEDSLHILRLAIDLNLFKDGKLLTRSEEYKALGEWWEKQSTKDYRCTWGGRFKKLPDGNHFSLENEGVK